MPGDTRKRQIGFQSGPMYLRPAVNGKALGIDGLKKKTQYKEVDR